MSDKRLTVVVVVGVLMSCALIWTAMLQSSTTTTVDFGRGCINFLSANGHSWVTTDPIPAEWTGPMTGKFTWRFGSGRFSADGAELAYSKTTAFGPCVAREIN